jgi:type II secretory ATPase GspE/PulE/Tfp pilus assembly ATPase PilB-like protein
MPIRQQEGQTVATVETKLEPARSAPAGGTHAGPEAAARALHLDLRDKDPEQVMPELVEYAARLRASDLFFGTDDDCVEVTARHLGVLRAIGTLSVETGRRCISYIKTMADMDISEHRRGMDGRWLFNRASGRRLDLRINTIPTLHGEDCAVRLLDRDQQLLALDQLGMDKPLYSHLADLLNSPSGLLLVTGPMETGKSTTLYACLSYLNNGERKINTIEDPIEYSIKGLRQSQVNAQVGLTFHELLRGVLRQAPHVIMVGEIRDPETAETAVGAANSGVLVLSTLHAPVASTAVHALLRMGSTRTWSRSRSWASCRNACCGPSARAARLPASVPTVDSAKRSSPGWGKGRARSCSRRRGAPSAT